MSSFASPELLRSRLRRIARSSSKLLRYARSSFKLLRSRLRRFARSSSKLLRSRLNSFASLGVPSNSFASPVLPPTRFWGIEERITRIKRLCFARLPSPLPWLPLLARRVEELRAKRRRRERRSLEELRAKRRRRERRSLALPLAAIPSWVFVGVRSRPSSRPIARAIRRVSSRPCAPMPSSCFAKLLRSARSSN